MSWKNKTCEQCFYRLAFECRINPPKLEDQGRYPIVMFKDNSYNGKLYLSDEPRYSYVQACSQYKVR